MIRAFVEHLASMLPEGTTAEQRAEWTAVLESLPITPLHRVFRLHGYYGLIPIEAADVKKRTEAKKRQREANKEPGEECGFSAVDSKAHVLRHCRDLIESLVVDVFVSCPKGFCWP